MAILQGVRDDNWFATATLVMPEPKEQISIRLDRDVLEQFRKYPRYQTRINAILRAAMEHEKNKAGPSTPRPSARTQL